MLEVSHWLVSKSLDGCASKSVIFFYFLRYCFHIKYCGTCPVALLRTTSRIVIGIHFPVYTAVRSPSNDDKKKKTGGPSHHPLDSQSQF